ncbi:MAG TPA: GAF domain-containing protein [Candidatus Methylomirabilis sp.]|nr:GAF domain-containing protein [Candidatus Methylomirabilis sp.]
MSQPEISPTELTAKLAELTREFPFDVELSLTPLIKFWEREGHDPQSLRGKLFETLRTALMEAPELAGPIHDVSALAKHQDLLGVLMDVVFPPAFWQQEYAAALVPFQLKSFYSTPLFARELMGTDGKLSGRLNIDWPTLGRFRLLNAYSLVLRRVWDIDFPIDYPLIFTVEDRTTSLDRHFKILFDGQFTDIEPTGATLPVLSAEIRERLAARTMGLDALIALIPRGSFKFSGFTVFRAVDVTDQEVLSSLKRDLIDKESIMSSERFTALQTKLRTLFRRPDLVLGLGAIEGDRVLSLNYGARFDHSCLFADSVHQKVSEFAGSIYMRASLERKPLFIEDLTVYPERTAVEEALLRDGVRNIVVAPLHYQEQTIGSLSLSSPNVADLTALQAPKVGEVLPLFSMAVKRSLDELDSRIQGFIKEQCTAIHPVVEWRFRKAVFDGLEGQESGPIKPPNQMPPIVFRDVYPFYAIADIRGSSTQRSWSIQADLLTQLGLARDVVRAAHGVRPLPILDHLTHRIDQHAADLEMSLRSGDEVTVIGFLRTAVESLFEHLRIFGPTVRDRIEAYRRAVDPQIGTVYHRRRQFDESVTLITETISAYLDLEEQAAQTMCPHYFEKQKTDGVDYTIYAGASLLESGAFDPLYLKNLRLSQLMIACGVTLRTERLKERLPVPLEVTNLILVQHAPLAIRFRFDEKRFDVDGAYNVRYEIIKKRIDKAVIRGTGERLTQPAKIAIVHSHASEAAEWRDYIEYLQRRGYLVPDVEEVELEELPGAQGLRALRVAVDLTASASATADLAIGAASSSTG